MSFYSIPPLATGLLALILCLFVALRNPKSIVNLTFAGVCLLTTHWQGSWTLLFNIDDPSSALLLAKVGYSGIIFIPIVFFHFITKFTNGGDEKLVGIFYALGVALLFSLWSSDLFIKGVYRYFWGFYPKAGLLHPFYLGALS